ncbi:hypothetical protein CGMCC3_g9425 [Colletotrichum fructicola]|nr:uncharacterized protein CGMCC3_g9425 [Colletotrichum fructicola]KAE9574492.1 hypothetical protein CGMCC3_g9425 [Colletotrichum fructicola]KAF5493143.1 hypothetical protein CGCF413_v010631 [Colletotrichum fructicola]
MLPYILSSKFLLNILEKATDDPRCHSFHGIFDSCLALLLIMAILSWYTPEEMILRFLLWAILCPRLTLMVVPLKIVSRFLGVEGALTMSNTFACVLRGCDRETKGFSGIFGQPMEISWLPTDQKSFLSLRAAMGKFTLGMNSHWPAKHRLFTMLSRGALVFAAGVLSKSYTGVWSKTDRDNVIDNVVIVLIASALGLVIYRIPSVTYYVMVACSTLSGCILLFLDFNSTPTNHYLLFQVLMSVTEMVLPFIWTIAVHKASTWSEAAGMICVAGAGSAVGQLTFDTHRQGAINFLLILAQMSIWPLFWVVYGRMGAAWVEGGLRFLWRATETPQNGGSVSGSLTTCGGV